VKDFFETWKFRILIAVAVFLAGLLLYAAANGRLTAAPQELLSVAAAPFQKAAAWVAGGVSSVWDKYTSIETPSCAASWPTTTSSRRKTRRSATWPASRRTTPR